MPNASKIFVQEFVIGLGFLSGLWLYVGFDPEAQIVGAFAGIAETLAPNSRASSLILTLPSIVTIVSVVAAYFAGGILGLIAVGLAFLGGIFLSSQLGIWMLIAGVICGLIAASSNSENRISPL